MVTLTSSRILIITNQDDFTADLVVKRLQERDIAYARFNTESFPIQIQGSIKINQDLQTLSLSSEKWRIQPEEVRSIWYRRPVASNVSQFLSHDWEKEFALRESWEFLSNVWLLLDDKQWLHHPDVLRRAEKKLLQLDLARSAGLQIPDTLVTNTPGDAMSFYLEHHRRVIAKPLSHGGYGEKSQHSIFTTDLENLQGVDFSDLQCGPAILQAKVVKAADVRVTVMGSQIFAYKIQSSAAEIDWRKVPHQQLHYEPCALPKHLLGQIEQLMAKLNLRFGALDFCIDTAGNWIFLEINPNGQWAWFDVQNKSTQMTDALIHLLYDQE